MAKKKISTKTKLVEIIRNVFFALPDIAHFENHYFNLISRQEKYKTLNA